MPLTPASHHRERSATAKEVALREGGLFINQRLDYYVKYNEKFSLEALHELRSSAGDCLWRVELHVGGWCRLVDDSSKSRGDDDSLIEMGGVPLEIQKRVPDCNISWYPY